MNVFRPLTHPLDGVHLIEASAGTGKTYSITWLVLRLIVEKGLSIEETLVVTFTEAATSELKEKIRHRLAEAQNALAKNNASVELADAHLYEELFSRIDVITAKRRVDAALRNFDRAKVFTIHGFCQRMIVEHAFETGMTFGLELKPDTDSFYSTLARDFWLAYCVDKPQFVVSYYIDNQLTVDGLSLLARSVQAKPSLDVVTSMIRKEEEHNFVSAYQQCRNLFWDCHDELLDIFARAQGLNGHRYSKRYLPSWINQTSVLLNEEVPRTVPKADEPLFKFAYSKMVESAKGAVEIEATAFFKSVDKLLEATVNMSGLLERTRAIFVEYVRVALPERKAKNGLLFFDDLLQKLDVALQQPNRDLLLKAVATHFKAALIDEFQDTDSVQYRIFSELFVTQGIPLYMIGDPKQAIYSFRGGDIYTYMNAADAARDTVVSLDTNWRSSSDLVAAVNGLFQRQPLPFVFDKLRFAPVNAAPKSENSYCVAGKRQPGFQFLFCRRTENNCVKKKDGTFKALAGSAQQHVERTCDDIEAMLSNGNTINDIPIRPSDIAVLVRKNDQAQEIMTALAQRNIVSVSSGARSVLETTAAEELFQILSAVSDCDTGLIKTAISTSAFGVGQEQLVRFATDIQFQDYWYGQFEQLQSLYVRDGIVALTSALLKLVVVPEDGGLKKRVLLSTDGNRYLIDILQLFEILHREYASRNVPIEQLVDEFGLLLCQPPTDEVYERRTMPGEDAVQIVTIHKSKGLQYPVVYLPYLFKDGNRRRQSVLMYHRAEDPSKEICDLRQQPDASAVSQWENEQKSEQMRLLYVALTRARNVCKVVWGAFTDAGRSSLAYLLHGKDAKEISSYSDEKLIRTLEQFCDEVGATVRVEPEPYTATGDISTLSNSISDNGDQYSCRTLNSKIEKFVGLKVSSFSGLAYQQSSVDISSMLEKQNEPAIVSSQQPEVESVDKANNGFDYQASDVNIADFKAFGAPFPRGAAFGNFVHSVWEMAFSFSRLSDKLPGIVDSCLKEFGYKKELWAPFALSWFKDVAACKIDSLYGFSLDTLSANCMAELEFMVPISAAHQFSANTLAEAMAKDANGAYAEYPRAVAQLPFTAFQGYLKGFIDLVCCHDNQYFIIDYKSNDLGTNVHNYASDKLHQDMAVHHYFLQYHLYALSLHRYLQRTMPSYDYDKNFGGVYYLYVRGMSAAHENRFGVFFDKPPRTRIEAMNRLLQGNGDAI